jgi:hypothetical protein
MQKRPQKSFFINPTLGSCPSIIQLILGNHWDPRGVGCLLHLRDVVLVKNILIGEVGTGCFMKVLSKNVNSDESRIHIVRRCRVRMGCNMIETVLAAHIERHIIHVLLLIVLREVRVTNCHKRFLFQLSLWQLIAHRSFWVGSFWLL